MGELTGYLRVVEHPQMLLPPDVGRAAEGFAGYDLVDGLGAAHGTAHGAEVTLAVIVGDAPAVVEDRRSDEFAETRPLEGLLVRDSLPSVHSVMVYVGFSADSLTEPAAYKLSVVGVDWTGERLPDALDFGCQHFAVGLVFSLHDAYLAVAERAEGEHAVGLGAKAHGLDINNRALDGDALKVESEGLH